MIARMLLFAIVFGWHLHAIAFNASYLKGKKQYKSYYFDKAIPHLKKSLTEQPELSKEEQLQVHLWLTISYYNQAQPKNAKKHFRSALELNSKAKLPKGQAPNVVSFFEKVRKEWLLETVNKLKNRKVPPVRRKPKERPGKRFTIVEVPTRRPVKKPVKKVPQQSFLRRHRISLIIIGAGVVCLAAGAGFGLMYNSENATYQKEFLEDPLKSGKKVQEAYESVKGTGLRATALLAAGGGIIAVGGIWMVVEMLMAPKAEAGPKTSLQQSTFKRTKVRSSIYFRTP